MRTTSPRSRLATSLAAGLLALGALTACSGAGDDSGASSAVGDSAADGGGAVELDATAPEARAAGADTSAGGSVTTVDPAVAALKVVRRASLGVRVDDVEEAAAEVRAIAAGLGGIVEAEDISTDPGSPDASDPDAPSSITSDGTITVSVPADELDTALDRLADVGTVLARSVTTENVTAQYADTESRVASARASVVRVRALMSEATKLADVVTLEAELSRRTADLEALESQLGALEGQVARSPVTVHLTTAPTLPAQDDDTGFLAGLAAGTEAFLTSVRVLLTVLGALLPFALAGAVVVGPLLVWWRRSRRPAAPPAPSA
jgi:hypothetical protein